MSEPDRAIADLARGFGQTLSAWARQNHASEASADCLRRIAEAISLATSDGQLCVPLSTVLDQFPGASIEELRALLLACGLVAQPAQARALPLILDDTNRVFLYRHFDQERRLARQLLVRTRSAVLTSDKRSQLQEVLDQGLGGSKAAGTGAAIDWQRVAVAQALLNPLTLISGGPGTGKTRTAAQLIQATLRHRPGARIALAAPTGKAAARLLDALHHPSTAVDEAIRERLPTDAFTIHRLLKIQPGTGRAHYGARDPLPYDLVVVDEASMLDLHLTVQLFGALADHAQCVLLGDKDQLPAVEIGAIFTTLSAGRRYSTQQLTALEQLTGYPAAEIEAGVHPDQSVLPDTVIWLQKNYRFSDDSDIFNLSESIKQGDTETALTILRQPKAMGARWIADDGWEINRSTLLAADQGYAPYREALARYLDPSEANPTPGSDPGPPLQTLFAAFERFRVLAAIRETDRGVNQLNAQLRRILNRGSQTWYPGRPILITRNDDSLNLFNGDVGICLPDSDLPNSRQPKVWFRAQGGFRAIDCQRLPAHEDALAMTVHKAQGSEFDSVLLILPHDQGRTTNRALIYTAITRARSEVILSGRQTVFEAACSQADSRPSGLTDRIRELIDASPSDSSG
jgi:exodeoxyribonuclease V alpha subunit